MSVRASLCCVALTLSLGVSSSALACLWDFDTLAMERSRFPSALELITGKFRRHTTEFYRWRIEDRLKKLETEPDRLEWLDDLGVAYDKVGEQPKAIEVMLRKEKIKPGLYETAANLGTFYIHSGQLEKGLGFIKKAIEINPDAHFGREEYQQYLVEYLLAGKAKANGDPKEGEDEDGDDPMARGFAAFLRGKIGHQVSSWNQAAVRGVLGMMRFGHHDSPILLEALGDVLQAGMMEDAARLAARAYLKASYEVKDEARRNQLRELADDALAMQVVGRGNHDTVSLAMIEESFRGELDDGRAWFEELAAKEKEWISQGLDADAEFVATYYEDPEVAVPLSARLQEWMPRRSTLVRLSLIFGGVGLYVFIMWRVRRSRAA